MKQSLVVNLFGGPCVGKSTLAAELYSELNKTKYTVELAHEFAKEICWDGNEKLLKNQLYILGNQLHRIERLNGKVNIIVTDSPLLLSVIYNKMFNKENFKKIILEAHNKFENFNIFIDRDRKREFINEGRNHTYGEAIKLDYKIKKMLDKNDISYTFHHPNLDFDVLFKKIMKEVKKI